MSPYEQGYWAAEDGYPKLCPYGENTKSYIEWCEGYDDYINLYDKYYDYFD